MQKVGEVKKVSRLKGIISWVHKLREESRERDKMWSKYMGIIEIFRKTESEPRAKFILSVAELAMKEVATRESEDLSILELVTALFSEQIRDTNALKNILVSLVAENENLSTKIENIDTWRVEREEMLKEIDDFVEQRRDFLDRHR